MEAKTLLIHQLKSIFLLSEEEERIICSGNVLPEAERRAINALKGFNNKYFHSSVDPLNSVIYCNYLYWVSHLLYLQNEIQIASKVYYLNKMLNSVELFYAVELPNIWSCEHPMGGVMGNAKYGDYFFYYQGCTVGGSWHKGELQYPVIGEHVTMFSNSKVLGNSHIGNNVVISANTYIINQDIPDNSIVFGTSPDIVIKVKSN